MQDKIEKMLGTKPSLQKMLCEIQSKLLASAQGMYVSSLVFVLINRFLYVALKLKDIEAHDVMTADNIRKCLDQSCPSLEEVYEKVFNRLSQLPEENRKLVRHIFLWMTYALRPLNLSEVMVAFALDLEKLDWKRDRVPSASDYKPEDIVNRLCGNLVEIIRSRSGNVRLQFIHSSVKDYILEKGSRLLPEQGRLETSSTLFSTAAEAHNVIILTSIMYLHFEGQRCCALSYERDWATMQSLASIIQSLPFAD